VPRLNSIDKINGFCIHLPSWRQFPMLPVGPPLTRSGH
jgi:hypothetical protein